MFSKTKFTFYLFTRLLLYLQAPKWTVQTHYHLRRSSQRTLSNATYLYSLNSDVLYSAVQPEPERRTWRHGLHGTLSDGSLSITDLTLGVYLRLTCACLIFVSGKKLDVLYYSKTENRLSVSCAIIFIYYEKSCKYHAQHKSMSTTTFNERFHSIIQAQSLHRMNRFECIRVQTEQQSYVTLHN